MSTPSFLLPVELGIEVMAVSEVELRERLANKNTFMVIVSRNETGIKANRYYANPLYNTLRERIDSVNFITSALTSSEDNPTSVFHSHSLRCSGSRCQSPRSPN